MHRNDVRGRARRADPPTGADRAIPKPAPELEMAIPGLKLSFQGSEWPFQGSELPFQGSEWPLQGSEWVKITILVRGIAIPGVKIIPEIGLVEAHLHHHQYHSHHHRLGSPEAIEGRNKS